MKASRSTLWQEMIELSPLCSGSLHEQYLACGKPTCRCHDSKSPKLHGPYFLWIRRINGRQVNRTLRPGPDVDRVRAGIRNYRRFQALFSQILGQEEEGVLSSERAVAAEGKKTPRRDSGEYEGFSGEPAFGIFIRRRDHRCGRRGGTVPRRRPTGSGGSFGATVGKCRFEGTRGMPEVRHGVTGFGITDEGISDSLWAYAHTTTRWLLQQLS